MSVEFPGSNWILLNENEKNSEMECELMRCAQRVWPLVLKSGRRRINVEISIEEKDRLIFEAWEYVLAAMARTLKNGGLKFNESFDVDAYLMKSFQHRLGRTMKPHRLHHRLFICEDPHKLEALAGGNRNAETDVCRQIQVQEVIARMDVWTREVWSYLSCGLSWKWIADRFSMNRAQAKMRYRYSLEKIRLGMKKHGKKEIKRACA